VQNEKETGGKAKEGKYNRPDEDSRQDSGLKIGGSGESRRAPSVSSFQGEDRPPPEKDGREGNEVVSDNEGKELGPKIKNIVRKRTGEPE